MTRCVIIGHQGARHQQSGNTLRAFDAAAAAGADMIELDALAVRGRLVCAHTFWHAVRHHRPLRLSDALTHLASAAFDGVRFNVDVKLAGYEQQVVEQVAEHGLLDRCVFSSQLPRVLDRVRDVTSDARVGLSVGGPLSRLLCHGPRKPVNDWVSDQLHTGRFDAIMAYHGVLSAAWVEQLRRVGGEVYAWVVDDLRRAEQLLAMGVHGLTTNNPALLCSWRAA